MNIYTHIIINVICKIADLLNCDIDNSIYILSCPTGCPFLIERYLVISHLLNLQSKCIKFTSKSKFC